LELNEAEASMGLAFFDALPLPDGLDEMTLGQAPGHGSVICARHLRIVGPGRAAAPSAISLFWLRKGQSKTTYSAGLMLTR
jgi:hypothetical protein